MEPCSSNIKKLRTFSQEEAVLIFQETELLIFQSEAPETNISYISQKNVLNKFF